MTPHMNPDASRLVLGCAQLAMGYGVANTTGRPSPDAALEIIRTCWAGGVRFFDTAQAYGDSEAVLGDCLRSLGVAGEAAVITKLPRQVSATPAGIAASVAASLDRLGMDALWGLMLHDEDALDAWDRGLGAALGDLKDGRLVAHLGVSVYSPRRALEAIARPGVDIVQVPASVFDRRMIRAGVREAAAAAGTRLFARSVYLQGLALMDPGSLPDELAFAGPAVAACRGFCDNHRVERRRFVLHYARDRCPSAMLVVGAETATQAAENCRLMSAPGLDDAVYDAWDACWPDDVPKLVDPSTWPRLANRR